MLHCNLTSSMVAGSPLTQEPCDMQVYDIRKEVSLESQFEISLTIPQ